MSQGASDEENTPQQLVPVLLLKTKSLPTDNYEEYLSSHGRATYDPRFVPVLEHRFTSESLDILKRLIEARAFDRSVLSNDDYGGLIFTSQRAVEAFSAVVEKIKAESPEIDQLLPKDLPLYVVGPATAVGLRALNLQCQIAGEEAGNGEALASFILEHYNEVWEKQSLRTLSKPPLLFLVGEQRRDIIPKTLQSETLPESQRILVDELIVYETGVMESFPSKFTSLAVPNLQQRTLQWIVVFSPTGCQAMLDALGMLDKSTGKIDASATRKNRTTLIATIGPTTRDYLLHEFDFEPDACAAKPSPQGVWEAIERYSVNQHHRT